MPTPTTIPAPGRQPRRGWFREWTCLWRQAAAERADERRTLRFLARLNDRELRDIGLYRDQVHDPAVAAYRTFADSA